MRNPQHIVITGASSGIGSALALRYAGPSVRLSLHGRDPNRLAAVAAQAEKLGAIVTTKSGDVTDASGMAEWIAACHQQQPIDLIIANAGISPGLKTGQETAENVRTVLATNINGVINTVQPAVVAMKQRGQGQIAIVASLAGFRGLSGSASYSASKAAVRVYGEALRDDLAAENIRVNVICPGFIETPMTEHNPFPMPFMMSTERAAQIIYIGLARNKARIAFPWPMYALVRFIALLPQDWVGAMVAHVRKKGR